MKRFATTLRALAEAQDNWAGSSGMTEQVREQLLSTYRHKQEHSRQRWVWVTASAFAAATVFAFAAYRLRSESPLTCLVGAQHTPVAQGAWVTASGSDDTALSFSDGSEFVLQQSAQARVVRVSPTGANLVLERGRLVASVVHRKLAQWELKAGPFNVSVRGTRFLLAWSPDTSTLDLELHEGVVEVSGPSLPSGTAVKAGQHLKVTAVNNGWMSQTSELGAQPTPASTEEVSAKSVLPPLGEPVSEGKTHLVAPKASASAPNWQELAAAGNYAESLSAARKTGLQKIYGAGSAADLARLAQVARFAGDTEVARSALRSIRERFAASAEAAVATFDLGRLAFDTSGRYLEAAHWFQGYLREYPHGNLAREARGRLIEALERGGDHAGAREAASEYLLHYPSGPHAGLARRLIGQ